MIHYREIRKVAERKILSPSKSVNLPRLTTADFGTPEHEAWVNANWWMVDYAVKTSLKEKAKALALKLHFLFLENPTHYDIPEIVRKLRRMKLKEHHKLTAHERWTKGALQLASYGGSFNVMQAITREFAPLQGKMLEAMCGHESYLNDAPTREVIALDYCEESLRRYPFCDRRRIKCDLDELGNGGTLPFFEDGELDAICVCFGIKYPKHIGPILREFHRILRKGGTVSFIEGEKTGYSELFHRKFDKVKFKNLFKRCGYSRVTIKKMNVANWPDFSGAFHHIKATK